jgi:hypothetical protein
LTTISSRPPTLTATGVPQPTEASRGVFQTGAPVRASKAAMKEPRY